jgi:hypothetical protein
MRSRRGSWLGSCLLAAAVVAMPGMCGVVRAQPGFGLDPFWPYNNQYAPYVAPVGPAQPAAGGRAPMLPQAGLRGANQFQDYLDSLQGGPGRNMSDRATIGTPYYRSAVNPLYDTRRSREYQPNRRTNETFERAQQRVADRYFAYYSTRDPAKRAELLKEYRAARRDSERVITGRGRSPSRAAASPSFDEPGSRPAAGAGPAAGAVSAAGRGGAMDRTPARTDRYGSAPGVPGLGSSRSSGSRSRSATPTDVLNRSRAMDRGMGLVPSTIGPRVRRPGLGVGVGASAPPGSGSSSRSSSRRPRQSAPDTPARTDDNP